MKGWSDIKGGLVTAYKLKWLYLIFLVGPFGMYCVFALYPIVDTFWVSLHRWSGLTPTMEFVGLSNYWELFGRRSFQVSLLNNIKWAIAMVVFPGGLGLLLAVVFDSPRVIGGKLLRVMVYIPMILSFVVLGLMWMLIYNPVVGLLNFVLEWMGLGFWKRMWLGDPGTALYALMFTSGWQYTGFCMLLFHAGLRQIPIELYEAAVIDGANAWSKFRYITLPSLREIGTIVVVLAVIQGVRIFDIVLVMTTGGPYEATSVLGFLMYKETFWHYRMGYGSAIAVTLFFILFGFALIYLRTGLKGEVRA